MKPMDQSARKITNLNQHNGQFEYLGRWVNKENFRAFVYGDKDAQQLANSYDEFKAMLASGLWFASKADLAQKRKPKDGTVRGNS